MLRKSLLFLLIVLCGYIAGAQTLVGTAAAPVLLSGTVKDSLGHSIQSATVTLVKTSNGAGAMFTHTDSAGRYHFSIAEKLQQEKLAVKVSAIGLQKAQQQIVDFSKPLNFILHQEVHQLQAVTVRSNVYIVRKADTLSFNVDLFRDSTDRVLGDLIRKIPGVEVDDDGRIKYNGKYINNFYIEGDNLLDDKYNIATANIPSKDVDKVEVIEHNQHIKMLNGIVPSDQPALNIRLKDRSRLHWINTADLAGGTPEKYSGKINSMAFKPKFKAINEISTNNIGNDLSQELMSHGLGDFQSAMENDQPSDLTSVELSRPSGISKNRYFFDKAFLANLNDMYKFRSGSTLRLNAYYLHDVQPFSTNSYTAFYLPSGDTVTYTEKADSRLQINRVQGSLNLNTNNEKKFFNETMLVNASTEKNAINIVTNGQQQLKEYLTTTINNFSNDLSGVFLLHKKQTIQYNSYISYYTNPQSFSIQPGWQQALLNNGSDYQQTLQNAKIPTWFTNNKISFIVRKGDWTFNNTAGIIYQHQQLQSNINLQQNDKTWTQPIGYRNHINWDKVKAFVQPNIMFEKGHNRINISLPISYNYIHYSDTATKTSDQLNRFYILPSVNYRLQIGKENELYASYNYANSLSQINQVYAAGILQNYRSIQSYNTPLIGGYYNNYGLRFTYKKRLHLFFWNVGANYSMQHRNYLYASTITNNLYQVQALPIQNQVKNASISGDISKYIFVLKTTLSASASIQNTQAQQMQNGLLFNVKNKSNTYNFGIAPKPFDWLKLDLQTSYLTYTSSSEAAGFDDQKASQWKQKSALTILPTRFLSIQFSSEYYASYRNGQRLANCIFLDSYINYRFLKPDVELRLSSTNLANEKSFEVIGVSNNTISSSSYALQSRMFLLSARFSF